MKPDWVIGWKVWVREGHLMCSSQDLVNLKTLKTFGRGAAYFKSYVVSQGPA